MSYNIPRPPLIPSDSDISSFSGIKTLSLNGDTSGSIVILPPSTVIKPYSLTLPAAQGARNTFLKNEGEGLLTWATTVDTGITTLNALTSLTQVFSTGVSGTDFNIYSVTDTHTFNIPVASSTNTGKLSSTDWSTFNSKLTSSLTSGSVFVGNNSGIATAVSISGDATLSNTGELTLASTAVTSGSYTLANVTIDEKGRVTTASSGDDDATITYLQTTNTDVTGSLKFVDSLNSFISFSAPSSITSSYSMTLPPAIGENGTVLTTDNTGVLSWKLVAGGSNNQIQFNSSGTLAGSSDLTWNGTNVKVTDNKAFVVGTGNDLTIVHDGSNSTVTSTTGNLVFDNTSVNDSTVFKLGTSTVATSFKVTDSSDQDIIVANGDLTVSMPGTVTIGDLSVTNSINNGIVDITGSVITGVTRVGGLSLPLNTDDATSKAYVDSIAVAGVSWKNSVRATSTVNVSPWPPTDGLDTVSVIDGYTLQVDDRVLIKDQTTTTQNGIWQVTPSTWIRPSDSDTSVKASGSAVWCTEGTVNQDKGFVCTTDGDVSFGSSILFSNFSSATNLALNDGLIYIGDENNLAYGRTLSGDMTITRTGVATLTSSIDGNKAFTGTVSTGALTVSPGSFTVTSGGITLSDNASQSISHTGGSGDLVISSGSNVVVDSVTFNNGAVSSVSTLDMSGTLTLSGNSQSVSHTGTGNLTIASVDGNVLVDTVVFNAGAVSSVSTLGMSENLTNSAGDILLTSASSQRITHTGASGEDLIVTSTNGNVVVDSVVFNDGAVSGISTLNVYDTVTLSGNSQSVSHTGTGNLSLSSDSGNVTVEGIVFDAGTVSSISTLGMSGNLSNSDGDILLTSASSQSITHTGASGENLVISSTNGNVLVDTVTFNAGAVSGVSTLDMSGTMTLSGNSQSVSHTGTGNLTISSVDGNVVVESVSFDGQDVSNLGMISLKDSTTNSVGIKASSSVTAYTLTLPPSVGLDQQVLITNASGVLSWAYYHGYGRVEVTGTAYTVGLTDDIIGVVTVSTPSTPVTINLPVISGFKQYNIVDEGGYASVNNIIVNTGSGNTINGLSSTAITGDYNSISIYNNGYSKWFIY